MASFDDLDLPMAIRRELTTRAGGDRLYVRTRERIDRSRVVEMRGSGMPITRIAREIGASERTVYRKLKGS